MPRARGVQRVTITDEAVILLLLLVRKGGEESREAIDKLRNQYRWIESHFVKQHLSSAKLSGIDEADVRSVTHVAMAKAIERYTYEPGTCPAAKLGAFIQQVVKRALLDFAFQNKRHVIGEELEERSSVCTVGPESILDSLSARDFALTLTSDELDALELMLGRKKVDPKLKEAIRAKASAFFDLWPQIGT